MGKCLILSRVSTLSQDLEQQTEQLIKEAHNRGFSDNEIIIVEDKESAIKLEELERNTLNQMKTHIENDDVQCVFIWEITRLSRQLPMLYSLRDYLQANHVQLYCHTPEFKLFDDNWTISQASNIVFALYAVMAESEMQIKKERFARGKAKKKAEGKFVGGKILYGYTVDSENRFIVNEEQAEIVKRIFKLYLSGEYSGRQISTLLYREGLIKQTSTKTREMFVTKILKNKSYCGTDIYKRLISDADFEKAQKLLAQYQIKPRRTYAENVYLGHKLLFCYDTNRQMMVRKADAAYIEPVSGFCININMVDSLLLHCADLAYRSHGLMDLEKYIKETETKLAEVNRRLANYDKEEKKIRASFDRIEERLILNRISDEKAEELENKLTLELNNLTVSRSEDINKQSYLVSELEAIQDKSDKPDKLIDIYSLTEGEQAEMIKKEISKVIVTKVDKEVYVLLVSYTNPLLDGESFKVHSKKHKIFKATWDGYDEVYFKLIKRFKRQH